MVGDSHWFDGSTWLGFGGGLALVTLGSLAAGVVGVLFISTIPWQVIVLRAPAKFRNKSEQLLI